MGSVKDLETLKEPTERILGIEDLLSQTDIQSLIGERCLTIFPIKGLRLLF